MMYSLFIRLTVHQIMSSNCLPTARETKLIIPMWKSVLWYLFFFFHCPISNHICWNYSYNHTFCKGSIIFTHVAFYSKHLQMEQGPRLRATALGPRRQVHKILTGTSFCELDRDQNSSHISAASSAKATHGAFTVHALKLKDKHNIKFYLPHANFWL